MFGIGREVMSPGLFSNARLERTFDCQSSEVVGPLLIAAPRQRSRFLGSQFAQALKISSSFCRWAYKGRHNPQGS